MDKEASELHTERHHIPGPIMRQILQLKREGKLEPISTRAYLLLLRTAKEADRELWWEARERHPAGKGRDS